jgi:hypothetical protein
VREPCRDVDGTEIEGATRELRGRYGLLLYRMEGNARDTERLPFALARAVARDVEAFRPRHVAFDMTDVTDFHGSPVGFLARPCASVRAQGGTVSVVLGPDHAPWVRRVLEICCVFRGGLATGPFPSVEALESALAPTTPEREVMAAGKRGGP